MSMRADSNDPAGEHSGAGTGEACDEHEPDVGALAALLASSERVVALTGAGVSVPSGIPDFRSPDSGLWNTVDPMDVATIDAFHRDTKGFWDFYRPRLDMVRQKRPNAAHEALVELERRGRCDAVITQNIDGLHQAAGSTGVVEVHGSIGTSSCTSCGATWTLDETESLFGDDGIATCTRCSGKVKPDVVLFGELLPAGAMERARDLAARADLLLCAGSSLEVYPVAELPALTHEGGGRIAVVTQGSTPYDEVADVRVTGDVATALPSAVSEL
ncbi:SIR2 family NAD-dependent protein deacylase [Haloechinothrix aidingensis]|nr:NAD-dependent deacylase [Haloechinothrix aidingensis]